MTRTCVVDRCRGRAAARGLCTKHLGLAPDPGNKVTRAGIVTGPHYVGRCGWTDEKYAAHMATLLGCTARYVLQTVEQHQRDTHPAGLCRREVDTLSKIAAGFGDVGMGETWAVTSLEQMGCVTTYVLRGRGRVRVAEITEEGRRRLSLARRMEHT